MHVHRHCRQQKDLSPLRRKKEFFRRLHIICLLCSLCISEKEFHISFCEFVFVRICLRRFLRYFDSMYRYQFEIGFLVQWKTKPVNGRKSNQVLLDFERMEGLYTGFYYFNLHFGKSLMKLAPRSMDFSFYLAEHQFGMFGEDVKYESSRTYKESRSIKDGKVVPEVGGGLCQLPWIMYHLCLQTNIKIIERHHHSKDIYDNNTRFAPLGSDATIVYGYKDFQILNNTADDICFFFSINHDLLSCSICTNQKLNKHDVVFTTKLSDNNQVLVETFINNKLCKQDIYLT